MLDELLTFKINLHSFSLLNSTTELPLSVKREGRKMSGHQRSVCTQQKSSLSLRATEFFKSAHKASAISWEICVEVEALGPILRLYKVKRRVGSGRRQRTN